MRVVLRNLFGLVSCLSYLEVKNTKNDPVFPGEQWFFYWKTSSTLWATYLAAVPRDRPIIIPINWGFHFDEKLGWDFGPSIPERNLFKLIDILKENQLNFCLLLPLTPSPFLTNGGVPSHCARFHSSSREGLHLTPIDSEGLYQRIFSYFEPKVFLYFSEFCLFLSKKIKEFGLKIDIWGALFSYYEGDKVVSFFEDRSLAFDQGFSRYLKNNAPSDVELSDPLQEEKLKKSFTFEVQQLFTTTAKDLFSHWRGEVTINCLGGGVTDTIKRNLQSSSATLDYISQTLDSYNRNSWFSSALLSKEEKGATLEQIINEHFDSKKIKKHFFPSLIANNDADQWEELEIISIFDTDRENFSSQGLYDFLETKFKWSYKNHSLFQFSPEWIDENQETIKIFHSKGIEKEKFIQILKFFLMGQRIILDQSHLTSEMRSKLEIFIIENNLKVQHVNFGSPITLCELGDGLLILYDGLKLSPDFFQKFWTKLFDILNAIQLQVKSSENVIGMWRIRKSSHYELNYLDVRRLNLYNPTSYKKIISVPLFSGFAFMKVVDPNYASAKSLNQIVEVELLPNGFLALDFGHYGDRK